MSTPTLRPRDIQARIRSGESPESVADAAGTSVEKIMPFAAPVIAEREHIAERALKASVRRRPGEPAGTARTLGDAVASHLSGLGVDVETVEWDAWRRSDGRWSLVALYATPARSGTAELTFDPPGNFVSLDNDDARWLVGDVLPTAAAPEPVRDDLAQVRERRLAPVPTHQPAAVPSAAEPAAEPAPQRAQQPTARSFDETLPIEEPLEAFLPEAPASPAAEPAAPAAEASRQPETRSESRPESPTEPEARPARRTPAKKRGRASVPSWDEIMFGGGNS